MVDGDALLLFVLASLALIVVPGPSVLYIVSRSLGDGRRAGIVSALGVQVGGIVHIAAATAGVSALLASSASAFSVVKYAGAAYLVALGVRRLLDSRSEEAPEQRPAAPTRTVFWQGVVVNVLNPKTALFFVAFLPQFVRSDETHASLRMLELSAVFMLLTLAVFVVYGVFAAAVRNHVISRPSVLTWMRRVFGGSFVALAGRLALTDR